jgi:hypothetical protein
MIGLATLAALVLFSSRLVDMGTHPATLHSASTEDLPLTVKPAVRTGRPLSVPEIRWCLSQDIWLRTAEARLATRRAIGHYNDLAGDFNRRCNGYRFRDDDREQAGRDIDGARDVIVAAALEEIQHLNGGPALARTTQELLETLGHDPGVIDGDYGPQTKAAIEAYQRGAGILADGLVSQELLRHLRVAVARRTSPGGAGNPSGAMNAGFR